MATRRDDLEALRDLLRTGLPEAKVSELPALSRELRMVLAELDGLPEVGSTAPADEIARKRLERRQQAAARAAAKG